MNGQYVFPHEESTFPLGQTFISIPHLALESFSIASCISSEISATFTTAMLEHRIT